MSANAAECVATVRCECGSTELELRPGTVVPHLVCPRCPSVPATPFPTLTLDGIDYDEEADAADFERLLG